MNNMTQQEFIHETKTRILHQHIEIIKNAIIQWGTNKFGSYVFHEHPRMSAEHEMTWYIADTRFRRVVLTWGDVDDNIEIRFVNNEYNVSEGMVSISPAAVVKGIGIDQYIEDRKSLIKIVREALHKKKKKEDSKMNNKELISSNDLYDLVNTQYRRFLDEDHNSPLSNGITGDIRIERTSGNDDSKAFEEIKIILHKPNPDNHETIHLIKYRTADHWSCCVDKLDNVFCNIYKDRVDREGYVCELFANPLVQYIITAVEEAIGPKETKEIAKEHDTDSWLINKFNKLICVLKTYCSEINQIDRHKKYYNTMSWDWSYMFNHNLLPPVTMTGDRYHYDYNPTSFKIFDMYDSNGDLMVKVDHETFEINFYFYHSATEPFLTISANDYMGHIKHLYYDSHFHMDEFRFKYLTELIEKELKIQIMNPFADPVIIDDTRATGFVPDKETLGKLCNYGATGKFESPKVHTEILTTLENFFRKYYKAEDICNDVYITKCLPERHELHLYNHGRRTKICAVYPNTGNNYMIFDSAGYAVCSIDAGIHKDIRLTRENAQKDLFWISMAANLARQLCFTINDQPFINYLTHGYPYHIVRRIAKESGIICDEDFCNKARRDATSFERVKEHVMAWIHTYVETHPEEFVKEPSDNSLAQPQITTTTKRHRGEKNKFEIEIVDNKDKIHRLHVVERVPGASYEIYNTGIYHSHISIVISINEDGFGVNMPIGKIYDHFTREQMESLCKYLGRVIKEDMVAILELEAVCKPCQLSNNQPLREVLDNSIDETSRISDEMITRSLGIAKVSDYVTNITGINEEDIYMATDEKKEKYNKIPIKDVQFNSKKKTTTVIFGEKTDPDKKKKKGSEEDKKSEDIIVVSKCSPKDKFDPEVGLAMCISKAYFGNRSKFEKAVAEWKNVSEARDKKKADDEKKKKAKQKKTKSTATKKKTGTRPGRPRKQSLAKKNKEIIIKETEIVDDKPNEVKVDDNTDNIIG